MASRNGHEAKRVGAVLVVGGGIGGMQASLDLAESGLKVYMVEAADSIGGKMAMLDKTFPTNDCAMCTISPKLVECGRHLNIEILTGATVDGLEGEAGNFTATVRQKPRYVDLNKCTGCGECALHCPVKLPDQFNMGMNDRRAIYKLYPQAVPNAYAIDKKGRAPCKDACPVSQSAQGYVALVREKRFDDAFRVIKDRNPFPGICGRICNHRCEDNCNRAQYDQAVSVAGLKRFVADQYYAAEHDSPMRVEQTKAEKVAVVGSGPAGLTAAQDLARLGYPVTVFEALPVAGGMMRVGIPSYRLPRQMVQHEIDDIVALGVDLRLNSRIESVDDLFAQGFKAVFVGVGAHAGRKLPIPGADHPNVLLNTTFLRDAALGNPPKLGKKVLVIGGGNVSMDCARTARRLGQPEVHLACLESREKMPAHDYEIADAEEEGVVVHPARTFKAIEIQEGQITGVRCDRVNFRGFDKDGKLDMDVIPDSEHVLECDTLIFAIGQGPELEAFTAAGLETTRRRTLAVDPDTLATTRPGVFAGGDAVTGTTFVVDAIAAGHKAAVSIDRFLRGEDLKVVEEKPEVVKLTRDDVLKKVDACEVAAWGRHHVPKLPVEERFAGDAFKEVELGFTEQTAVAEANRCLSCGVCSECLECVRACQAGAIIHDDKEKIREIEVGAVVLAPGYQLYDARLSEEFGLGRYPNVLSSMQFERLLSASGPTSGHVARPSDHAEPKRIAFLQCVGSRDQKHDYCSSVCCMYAAKEAMLAKEHVPDVDVQIFMMDMRAFSKGYTAYYERASKMYGVGFQRCRISSLKENAANHNLQVRYYTDDGAIATEEFDMVVLSVGMETSSEAKRLAQNVGIELNPLGFCQVEAYRPLETTREGVFVCGPFAEPKDIPETVMEASGAAAKAMALLSSARGTEVRKKEYPPERDVTGEEARIGVFVCHCGSNIAGVIDVEGVVQYAKALPGVVHAERNLYTCSEDTQRNIAAKIREHGLNRVIVSSCTPRTHEPLFQETLKEAGINPYLFEMANIRDQDSWVHRNDKAAASKKAKALVRMAAARANLLEPLQKESLGVTARALVLGGGVAGMTAALAIADQGFDVALVEKKSELGGNMRRLRFSTLGKDPQAFLNNLIARVESHDLIQVYKNAHVVKHSGFVGNFKTVVKVDSAGAPGKESDALTRLFSEIGVPDGELEIEHGVTVIATGAREARPDEYLLGRNDRVMTQLDLEAKLAESPQDVQKANTVAMIQCVGAESEEYCSRVCCTQALKNAITVKDLNPAAQVYVLFKDMRTFGFKEQVYTEAREKGVLFVRYDDATKPVVEAAGGRLSVRAMDPILGEPMDLSPDLLVLSTAIAPGESNLEINSTFKLPLSVEGFMLEAHVKLRPVDFPTEGVFLCGLAHYPKFLEESMSQAYAAAARAATVLTKEQLRVGGVVSRVDETKCAACLTCVRVCPYGVPKINERGVAEIEVANCQGCGTCASECPAKAIQLLHYRDAQIIAKTDALMRELVEV